MRVLIVSQYFWPEDFRVNELAKGLIDRGNDVTVLTGLPNYPAGAIFPDFKAAPSRFAEYAAVKVVRVPILPRGTSRLQLLLNYLVFVLSGITFGVWRLRGRSYDVILVNQLSPVTSALPALLLGKIKRAPVAMWILDLWPETLSAVGTIQSRFLLRCVGTLVSFIYKRLDLILVQSMAFVESIRRYGGDVNKVRYLPAWVEQVFESPVTADAAPEMAPFREYFTVLFAGNMGEAQDFPAILAAADLVRDHPRIRWVIVGDGRAADSVKTELARRGLEERVVLLGRYPQERMPSFFVAADALLVSLKSAEPFSMTIPGKVQSYLGSGRPILGMLDGEGARQITSAGAGFVGPSGDSATLAENVLKLAGADLGRRREMGRLGREYCKREFNRSTLLDRLQEWLSDLTQRKKRS